MICNSNGKLELLGWVDQPLLGGALAIKEKSVSFGRIITYLIFSWCELAPHSLLLAREVLRLASASLF